MTGSRAAPADEVVATHRDGAITRADVDDWSRFLELDRGAPPRLDERSRVEEIVVLRTLARRGTPGAPCDEEVVRRRQLEQRCAERLLRARLLAAAEAPEEEIRAEYERRLPTLGRPARWRLQDIFKAVPPEAVEDVREAGRAALESLRERAVGGEDFAGLARQESESANRHRGGLSSPTTLERLAPELSRVVDGMAVGDISPVVELPSGLVVVRVAEVLPARTPPLAEVLARLGADLRSQRFAAEWRRVTEVGLAALDVLMVTGGDASPGAAVATWREPDGSRREVRLVEVEVWARDTGETRRDGVTETVWLAQRVRELAEIEVRAREAERCGVTASDDYRTLATWRLLQMAAQDTANRIGGASVGEPTEEALRATHEADPDAWTEPRRRRIQLLKAPIGPELTAARYERLGELGREVSGTCDDLRESASGLEPPLEVEDLGWLTDSQVWRLGRNVQLAVDALACGACSSLVQEGRWLVVVRVADCRDGRRLGFEEARPAVRSRLLAQALRRAGELLRREILEEQAVVMIGVAP